jgi:hypothetical protein
VKQSILRSGVREKIGADFRLSGFVGDGPTVPYTANRAAPLVVSIAVLSAVEGSNQEWIFQIRQ